MGDMSAEPSMEEILSSIKRIIAEEGDGPARARRTQRLATPSPADEPGNEILELSEPAPAGPPETTAATLPPPGAVQPKVQPEPAPAASAHQPEPNTSASILSSQAEEASRSALDALSRMLVKPEPGSDGTLEGLVREMLRPMLREWLDAHLPAIVESMVQAEIVRITGRSR